MAIGDTHPGSIESGTKKRRPKGTGPQRKSDLMIFYSGEGVKIEQVFKDKRKAFEYLQANPGMKCHVQKAE